MICKEIIKTIQEDVPSGYAMDWDNVGLLVGREDKEVKTIYLAVDATDKVIEDAAAKDADLLITHHPMIFSGLKKIVKEDFTGRRVIRLIQEDLSYYAMHTNYDVARMADLASDILGLKDKEVLEETESQEQGIGKIGMLESMTVKECCDLVKEKFHLANVKLFGDPEKQIQRAAILPGSGKSCIDLALEKGAQVYITGDVDHHAGIDAVARDLAIIDAGHYGIEKIFIHDMKEYLERKFPDMKVYEAPIEDPFVVL